MKNKGTKEYNHLKCDGFKLKAKLMKQFIWSPAKHLLVEGRGVVVSKWFVNDEEKNNYKKRLLL